MRACVLTDWEKLEIKDVPIPAIGENQALIKTVYAGICGSDVTVSRHKHPTATVPRIMCHEILGRIEKLGSPSEEFAIGDRVVIHPLSHCGVCAACQAGNFHVCAHLGIKGLHSDGGFAEYVSSDTDVLFRVPDDIPDKVAILTEPFAVGFHALVRAGVTAGDSVLVIGGGPIGILAAMCAVYFGAKPVISEPNPKRVALIQSLGLDVINPAECDIRQEIDRRTKGVGFDRVVEASGSAAGAALLCSACRISGSAVLIGIPTVPVSYETPKLILKEITIYGTRVYTKDHFRRSLEMVCAFYRSKRFDLSKLIDCVLPLEKLAEGIDMQAHGKNRGKILIDTHA